MRLSLALLMVLLSCRPFLSMKDEAGRIHREARELRDDVNDLLPSTLKSAATIAREAIEASRRISRDPEVFRVVARSTATLLAHEAAKEILLKKARRFDEVFGTDRSEALCAMVLSTYGYPILDRFIARSIELRLKEGPDTGTAAWVDSLIRVFIEEMDFDLTIDMIKGFGTPSATPEYHSAIGMYSVCSDTYAVTRNWKDHGLVYQYRISGKRLELKRSDGPWEHLPIPGDRTPSMIAADNNRCLVFTAEKEIWWYCARDDQARWSSDLMSTATGMIALAPEAGGTVCAELVPLMTAVTDSVAAKASGLRYLNRWKHRTPGGSGRYWEDRCRAIQDVVPGIERQLLKTGDGSFTARDYAEWSARAHAGNSWSDLLSWTSGDVTFRRGLNVPVDSITDIAIGNWNGTVISVYILALGKIWFIDEEIIHPEWKAIENWNEQWAVIGKKYHTIKNSPFPLDGRSRIDASNSVIAVSRKNGTAVNIFWLRWDYHQKDDFIYWPLDWCEHSWYSVECPQGSTTDFRISTVCGLDPREKNTVWSVPAPAFTFHNYLPAEGYEGIFGDVPRKQVSAYPVDLFISGESGAVFHFSAKQADRFIGERARWSRD